MNNKKNYIIISGILGIAILGVGGYFLYQSIKNKKDKENAQKQKNERYFEIVR